MLRRYGARFHGWIANAAVPEVFARHRFTVHVPRRYYTQMLPGIPTIRVFESLACGLPLISAPWDDCENLFRPGIDYLVAETGEAMESHMRALSHEPALAESLAASGLSRILSHHSCDIRARELLGIVAGLTAQPVAA
jgi:spore maturation protein CgeB